MKGLYKFLAAFTNACSYAGGIFVALMLMLSKKYVPVFSVAGFSQNENLIFNLLALEIPLLILCIIVCQMASDSKPRRFTVEFPTVYTLAPLAIAIINTVFALRLDTGREKMFVIVGSIIYFIAAAIMVFFGSKTFQIYNNDIESESDE